MTPYFTPPHTPKASFASLGPAPQHFPEPPTARPGFDDQPPTTEDAFPAFTVSTILPNFLYLGPELTAAEHVRELRDLGVKRIVNIAAECDDDHGLGLREVFDKYLHIPMRDTVEEDNITRGVRVVCDFLGEPSSPFLLLPLLTRGFHERPPFLQMMPDYILHLRMYTARLGNHVQ